MGNLPTTRTHHTGGGGEALGWFWWADCPQRGRFDVGAGVVGRLPTLRSAAVGMVGRLPTLQFGEDFGGGGVGGEAALGHGLGLIGHRAAQVGVAVEPG